MSRHWRYLGGAQSHYFEYRAIYEFDPVPHGNGVCCRIEIPTDGKYFTTLWLGYNTEAAFVKDWEEFELPETEKDPAEDELAYSKVRTEALTQANEAMSVKRLKGPKVYGMVGRHATDADLTEEIGYWLRKRRIPYTVIPEPDTDNVLVCVVASAEEKADILEVGFNLVELQECKLEELLGALTGKEGSDADICLER